MEIVDRIIEVLKQKNISEYRLMLDCNLNKNSFDYWKRGRQKPSLSTLIKIANYFDVSVDYLIGRTDIKEVNK